MARLLWPWLGKAVILFCLLISVLPLVVHPFWGKVVGGMTMMKYLGGVCAVYAIFDLARRGSFPRIFETPQSRWFSVFAVMAITSFVVSGSEVSLSSDVFVIYVSQILMLCITLALTYSVARLRWVLLSAIGSVAFASLYVIREWQTFHNIYPDFRPGFMTGDPNYFSESALAFLPLNVYLCFEDGPRWQKLFCRACLPVVLIAFILAASRGGFIGLVGAMIFVVLRTRKPIRNLVMLAAILVPAAILSPVSPLERLIHPSTSDGEATESRRIVWRAGIRMIEAHPVTGVGVSNFKGVVADYTVNDPIVISMAHNTYLEMAAEMGIPGFVLFLGVLGSTGWSLEKTRRRSKNGGPLLVYQAACGLEAGLFGCAIAIFFLSGEYQKLFWFLIFVSCALPPVMRHSLARRAAALNRESGGEDIVPHLQELAVLEGGVQR